MSVNTIYQLHPLIFIVWKYDGIKPADSWELIPHIAWMQGMKVRFLINVVLDCASWFNCRVKTRLQITQARKWLGWVKKTTLSFV